MTDSEAVRLCAEAMETPATLPGSSDIWGVMIKWENGEKKLHQWVRDSYDPLHDDAQAMALAKKFRIHLSFHYDAEQWIAKDPYCGRLVRSSEKWDEDMNRAIVLCVAGMREAIATNRAHP